MQNLINAHDRRGFTLTEIAIVLGIIGIILSAIWVAASMVSSNMRLNKAKTEIFVIASGVRSLFSVRSSIDSSGNLTSSLINTNVFPSDMINNGATVNPWGTTGGDGANGISVGTNGGWPCVGNSGNQFGIVLWGVPTKSACIGILTAMTGPAATSNGINCVYSDGTGSIALDGSADTLVQTSCSGNIAIGFNFP